MSFSISECILGIDKLSPSIVIISTGIIMTMVGGFTFGMGTCSVSSFVLLILVSAPIKVALILFHDCLLLAQGVLRV